MADPAPASAGRGAARAWAWGGLALLVLAGLAGWAAWVSTDHEPMRLVAHAPAASAPMDAGATAGAGPEDASSDPDLAPVAVAKPSPPSASAPFDILEYRHRMDQAEQGPLQAMAAVEVLQQCEDPEAMETALVHLRSANDSAPLYHEVRAMVEQARVLCPTLTASDHARLKSLALIGMRGNAPGGLFTATRLMAPDDPPELRREVWDHLQRGVARCDGEALSVVNIARGFTSSMGMTDEQAMDYQSAHVLLIGRQAGLPRPTLEQEVAERSWSNEASREAYLAMRREQALRAAALFKTCAEVPVTQD